MKSKIIETSKPKSNKYLALKASRMDTSLVVTPSEVF